MQCTQAGFVGYLRYLGVGGNAREEELRGGDHDQPKVKAVPAGRRAVEVALGPERRLLEAALEEEDKGEDRVPEVELIRVPTPANKCL